MIITIGYGNRKVDELIALLERYLCGILVDVRSSPFSRYRPEFNRGNLESSVEKAGIRYLFMGDRLGGRPVNRELYNPDGTVDYERLAQAPFFRDGIRELLALSESLRVSARAAEQSEPDELAPVIALLCSELVPEHCHRYRLIGAALQREGVDVRHIDADGQLLSQDDVARRGNGE